MGSAYDPVGVAGDKFYAAGNSQKVSPKVLFMFYYWDSFNGAFFNAAGKLTRKLPFKLNGLYSD